MVAAAIGGGAAISGVTGLIGSSQSASAQQQASANQLAATQAAIQAEQSQYQSGLQFTAPYATTGTATENELAAELGIGSTNPAWGNYGALAAAPPLTDVSGLPGYSFTLQQGENAVNNAASATGQAAVPGSGNYSGAQAKGNINYAEGLAGTYYNNYVQNYWTNQNNRFNMLSDLVNKGLGASTSIQGNAVTTGGQIGTSGLSGTAAANNLAVGAANTQAAGITGLGSSLGSSLLLANALGNTGTTISPASSPGVNVDYSGGGDVSAGFPAIG